MDFEKPSKGFYIYSKSGCPNCIKVKTLLKDNNLNFTIINCDEYILENKFSFLEFMKEISQKEIKIFPMIFFENLSLHSLFLIKELDFIL
jgi:glutaredoxin